MKPAVAAALLLSLAACVPPVTTSVQNLPAVSRSAAAVWTTEFNVRTYADDHVSEIEGATCQVEGPGFSGTVTTPARIRFPVFKAGRVTTTLTCSYGPRTVTVQKVCRYSASEPQSPYVVDVSTCNQSNVPVVFGY